MTPLTYYISIFIPIGRVVTAHTDQETIFHIAGIKIGSWPRANARFGHSAAFRRGCSSQPRFYLIVYQLRFRALNSYAVSTNHAVWLTLYQIGDSSEFHICWIPLHGRRLQLHCGRLMRIFINLPPTIYSESPDTANAINDMITLR